MTEESPKYSIDTRIEDLHPAHHIKLGSLLNDQLLYKLFYRHLDFRQRDSKTVESSRPTSAGSSLLHICTDKDQSTTIGKLRDIIIQSGAEANSNEHLQKILTLLNTWIETGTKYNDKTRIEDLETSDHQLLGKLIDDYNLHPEIASKFRLTEREARTAHEYNLETPGERLLHVCVKRDPLITIGNLLEMINLIQPTASCQAQQQLGTMRQLLHVWTGEPLEDTMQGLSINPVSGDALVSSGAEGGVMLPLQCTEQTVTDNRSLQPIGSVMSSQRDSYILRHVQVSRVVSDPNSLDTETIAVQVTEDSDSAQHEPPMN